MPRVRFTACKSETMHGQPHPLNFLRHALCSEEPELPTAIQSDFRELMSTPGRKRPFERQQLQELGVPFDAERYLHFPHQCSCHPF